MNSKNNPINDQNVITKETEKQSVKKECIGIYGLKNKINNKWYVGQSAVSIAGRWNEYRRLQCYNQPKLLNALTKYGIDNFDKIILEECSGDQKLLDKREDYWIRHHDSVENGYNCRYGGANGKFSEEAKQRVREGCKKKVYTDELKKKLSENGKKGKGKAKSEETKQKMRESQKRRFIDDPTLSSIEHMRNMAKIRHSTPVSEETRQKLSRRAKGKIISQEQKDKLSKSLSEHYQTHKHCWNDRSHTDKSKAKMAMYIWITDGTQSKRHIRTEPIPVGYKKGRLYKRKLIEP